MKITHNEKELHLEYTFNSFKYMEDLDMGELATLETKPFKMIGFAQILLLGALNSNPKEHIDLVTVNDILEKSVEDGNLIELITDLVELLQQSSFFKNLQKTEPKKKVKK